PRSCLLSLHDALPISPCPERRTVARQRRHGWGIDAQRKIVVTAETTAVPRSERQYRCRALSGRTGGVDAARRIGSCSPRSSPGRSEEHTSELQSRENL